MVSPVSRFNTCNSISATRRRRCRRRLRSPEGSGASVTVSSSTSVSISENLLTLLRQFTVERAVDFEFRVQKVKVLDSPPHDLWAARERRSSGGAARAARDTDCCASSHASLALAIPRVVATTRQMMILWQKITNVMPHSRLSPLSFDKVIDHCLVGEIAGLFDRIILDEELAAFCEQLDRGERLVAVFADFLVPLFDGALVKGSCRGARVSPRPGDGGDGARRSREVAAATDLASRASTT